MSRKKKMILCFFGTFEKKWFLKISVEKWAEFSFFLQKTYCFETKIMAFKKKKVTVSTVFISKIDFELRIKKKNDDIQSHFFSAGVILAFFFWGLISPSSMISSFFSELWYLQVAFRQTR